MAHKQLTQDVIDLIYALRQDPDLKLSSKEIIKEVQPQVREGLVDAGDYDPSRMSAQNVVNYGGPKQPWHTHGFKSKTKKDWYESLKISDDSDVVRHYNSGVGKDNPIDMTQSGWEELVTQRMRNTYNSKVKRGLEKKEDPEIRQGTYEGKKQRIKELLKNIDEASFEEFWPRGSAFDDVIQSDLFREKYEQLASDSGLYELENAKKGSAASHKAIDIFEELLRHDFPNKIPGSQLPVYTTNTPEDTQKLLETAERLALRTLDYQIQRAGVQAKMLLMNPKEMERIANEIFRYKLEDLLSGQRRHLSHYVALNDDGTYGLTLRSNFFVEPSKQNIARGKRPISDRVTGEILDLDAQNLFDTSSFRLPDDYTEGLISQPVTHEGVFPTFGTNEMLSKALTNQQIPWLKSDPKAMSLALDRATQAGHNTMFQQKLNDLNRMIGAESKTPLGKQSSGSVTSQAGVTRWSPQWKPLNWWDRMGVAIKKRTPVRTLGRGTGGGAGSRR